jgi:hypothetical protein
MVLPFGVSVGDFIAGIQLLCEGLQALNDASGASYDHNQLHLTLKTLASALSKVEGLALNCAQTAQQQAIEEAVGELREFMSAFLVSIEKYNIIGKNPTASDPKPKVKRAMRKLQWSLFKKEDIAKFQKTVAGHVNNLQLLLGPLQM